jgi:rod shape-determining protein MreD
VKRRRRIGWFWPLASLIGALALSIVPMPAAMALVWPDWVALVLIYWAVVTPGRFGMFSAFLMGIALDTLTGALLGQHALALLLVVYLSQRFYLRIRVFPASQLALTVAVLLALYQFVLFWVDGVAGRTVPIAERWVPVLTGTLLWFMALVLTDRRSDRAHAQI